ncbi:aldo/keto reductase [Embleya sp. NPDC055664]
MKPTPPTPLERRHLPGLNQEVSALGAGCWTIGGRAINGGVPIGWDNVDPESAYAALVRAYELGITLFDTADVYGLGRSERFLGHLLAEVPRHRVTVGSKVGYFAGTGAHPYEPEQMHHQLRTTLRNLGTDRLDLYFLHSDDFGPNDMHFTHAVRQMQTFRRDGLIKAIGMRAPHEFAVEWAHGDDHRAEETRRFLHRFEAIRPDVLSVRHNLLSPLYGNDETDIFAFAKEKGVGVVVKQALGQGLLTGAHDPDASRRFSREDHRSRDPRFLSENLRLVHDALTPIRERFGDTTQALARVALRYVLAHAPDAPVLVGFRSAAQIETDVHCLGPPLDPDDFTLVRESLGALRTELAVRLRQAADG